VSEIIENEMPSKCDLHNIEEKQKAHEELLQQNLRLKFFVDSMNIGLWDMKINPYDHADGISEVWWSDELKEMMGYTDKNSFTFDTWFERIHPDDKQKTLDAYNAHVNDYTGKTPYNIEYRICFEGGKYRYFHEFGAALRDENGIPFRFVGAMKDITEQKRIEREIAEKDVLNKIMFDNAPIGITVFDENFKYVDCNEKVLKMYDVTREFYITYFGSAAHSPKYQPDGSKSYEKAMEVIKRVMDGEVMRIGWVHQTPDGEPLPTELTLVRAKQGDKYIGLGYIYDMREQNRLKMAIENALLESQNAYRAKSEFLSHMSHEMLTPMHAIMGMTQLVKMQSINAQTREFIDEIETASRHLLRQINDMLELSGKNDSALILKESVFSFNSMFQNVLKEIGGDITKKQQIFTFDIDPSIPVTLIGDESRLAQVIFYLLSNAVKFTSKHGEIHFSTCILNQDDAAIFLQIEITDNGIGISKEQQSEIFNVFEQADVSSTRSHGGFGLGLPVSRRIVEMMGGKIWVESELGKGSKFTFTCKLRKR
jgi:PAS domain S-box-containing protein